MEGDNLRSRELKNDLKDNETPNLRSGEKDIYGNSVISRFLVWLYDKMKAHEKKLLSVKILIGLSTLVFGAIIAFFGLMVTDVWIVGIGAVLIIYSLVALFNPEKLSLNPLKMLFGKD